MREKSLTICYLGNSFSLEVTRSIIESSLQLCNKFNINFINNFDANIYESRNKALVKCLEIDADYILMLDGDIVFDHEDVTNLLNSDKDFISGLYLMEDRIQYTVVENWNEKFLKSNGNFEFLKPSNLKFKEDIFPCIYTGLGFSLVKQSIFQQLEYPWFDYRMFEILECRDFCMEDVGFCLNCRDAGITPYINKNVKVGHQKSFIID